MQPCSLILTVAWLSIHLSIYPKQTFIDLWLAVFIKHIFALYEKSQLFFSFQVFFSASDTTSTSSSKLIESPDTHRTLLTDLLKYQRYRIQVLAYTRVGDGVLNEDAVFAKTHSDGNNAGANRQLYVESLLWTVF